MACVPVDGAPGTTDFYYPLFGRTYYGAWNDEPGILTEVASGHVDFDNAIANPNDYEFDIASFTYDAGTVDLRYGWPAAFVFEITNYVLSGGLDGMQIVASTPEFGDEAYYTVTGNTPPGGDPSGGAGLPPLTVTFRARRVPFNFTICSFDYTISVAGFGWRWADPLPPAGPYTSAAIKLFSLGAGGTPPTDWYKRAFDASSWSDPVGAAVGPAGSLRNPAIWASRFPTVLGEGMLYRLDDYLPDPVDEIGYAVNGWLPYELDLSGQIYRGAPGANLAITELYLNDHPLDLGAISYSNFNGTTLWSATYADWSGYPLDPSWIETTTRRNVIAFRTAIDVVPTIITSGQYYDASFVGPPDRRPEGMLAGLAVHDFFVGILTCVDMAKGSVQYVLG
jgi:hypothetical protein